MIKQCNNKNVDLSFLNDITLQFEKQLVKIKKNQKISKAQQILNRNKFLELKHNKCFKNMNFSFVQTKNVKIKKRKNKNDSTKKKFQKLSTTNQFTNNKVNESFKDNLSTYFHIENTFRNDFYFASQFQCPLTKLHYNGIQTMHQSHIKQVQSEILDNNNKQKFYFMSPQILVGQNKCDIIRTSKGTQIQLILNQFLLE